MNSKKLKTQLLAAVAMTLVAVIALGSSTFAWFAANTKVEATGMKVTATTTSNLLIAEDTLTSTSKLADDLFKTSVSVDFGTDGKLLQPVSTIDGTNFYYTKGTNVKGDGDAIADEYKLLTGDGSTDGDFKGENYYNNDKSLGYVDYVFQLKAINSFGEKAEIRLTKLDLTYNNTEAAKQDNSKAYRVAVFTEDISTANPASGVGTLDKIYSVADAANHTVGKAVNSENNLGDVNTANNVVATMDDSKTTGMYKVVVRLWLEGEDKTCTSSTFMDLKDNWTLDIALDLVKADDTTTTSVPNIIKTNKTT